MQSKLTMLIAIAAVCATTLWAGWGPEEQLTNSDYYGNYSPYVVVGSNNYKHLVWGSRNHANEQRYYARWYPKGGWTAPMTIKSPAKYCFANFALALDGNSKDIHVAWQALDPGSCVRRAYYAKCVPGTKGTGTWGQTFRLTPDRWTGNVDVVSFNDHVAVAFGLGYGYRPSDDTFQTNPEVGFKECIGKNWQPTQYINLGIKAGGVSIAADAQVRYGDVFYLYQYQNEAYVMPRVGGTFQDPELAATGIHWEDATIEVDPVTGFPHVLCCCGPDEGPCHVYHTYRNADGVWQPLTMVSDPASPSSAGPRMCFSGEDIWVVWDEYDGNTYGIAYAVGEYDNWTRGWVVSGYDNGSPDIAPMPDGGLYCVWADGRATPTQIWGSTYTTSFGEGGSAQPGALSQSVIELAPNPAKAGRVTVQYALPHAGPANVTLLDVSGRTVRRSEFGVRSSGEGSFALDARGLKPGVYILKLESGSTSQTRKLVIQ